MYFNGTTVIAEYFGLVKAGEEGVTYYSDCTFVGQMSMTGKAVFFSGIFTEAELPEGDFDYSFIGCILPKSWIGKVKAEACVYKDTLPTKSPETKQEKSYFIPEPELSKQTVPFCELHCMYHVVDPTLHHYLSTFPRKMTYYCPKCRDAKEHGGLSWSPL